MRIIVLLVSLILPVNEGRETMIRIGMQKDKWSGNMSIECSGADYKIGASVEYLRGIAK